MANPADYIETLALYRRIETARYRALRLLFGLAPEDIAFFVWSEGASTRAAVKKCCREYYAGLVSLLRFERDHWALRSLREQKGLALTETAFLLSFGTGNDQPLPNNLRAARMRTGLSQQDAALLLGISRRKLSAYEREAKTPYLETAIGFSLLYDMQLNELFARLAEQIGTEQNAGMEILVRWRERRLAVLQSRNRADSK